jgi:hypothetical protein
LCDCVIVWLCGCVTSNQPLYDCVYDANAENADITEPPTI